MANLTNSPIYRGLIDGGTWVVRRGFPKADDQRIGHCRSCGEPVYRRDPLAASIGGDGLRCAHKARCEVAGAARPGEAGTDAG